MKRRLMFLALICLIISTSHVLRKSSEINEKIAMIDSLSKKAALLEDSAYKIANHRNSKGL